MSGATAVAPAQSRCAIYTRKSTTDGLEQDFNSLDNQRERAEAFVTSQDWIALPDHYDDGGFSGGNADRPALKRLLSDAKADNFDVIIVYKLDRLSRSLVDFVKIHEQLEGHGVALVSVTESLNTQTPHGRMMVNMLLSFAQYERELAAERTRHKIEAARRHGKWTGGQPPLGYDLAPEGGKLVVNKDEAQQVRAICELYLERKSLVGVTQELNRRGWTTKSWTTRTGKPHVGRPWNVITVRTLLTNPIYIGKQKLGGEVFPGEHRGIVHKKEFDRVQRLMAGNRRTGGSAARNTHGFLLRGLIRCSSCDSPMTADTPRGRKGRQYRYYRCSNSMKKGAAACPTRSISADKIEQLVISEIRRIGASSELQDETFRQAVAQVKAERRGMKAERKRLERDLSAARNESQRLVTALARADAAAGDAIQRELQAVQERIGTMETRQAEIQTGLADLDSQAIDRTDLARALEDFDPIWEVLLTPERERVVQLLIDRIDYNGETEEVGISWSLAGFGELAAEVAP